MDPLGGMVDAVIDFIPDLVFLVVLFFITRYLLKLARGVFTAIENKRLQIKGGFGMNSMARLGIIFAVLTLLYLTGCASIGPGSVSRDRFAYTDAISESWKKQMLINMVKIRYADAPVFLEVVSIINQYGLETEFNAGFSWNAFLPTDSQQFGGRGRYLERPTITYQPLTGDKFTRSLMTPIPPAGLMSLLESGWRADMLFRLCLQSVNGIYNRRAGNMDLFEPDPEFYVLISSLRKVQESRAVGIRVLETKDKKKNNVMFFRKKGVSPEVVAESNKVRKLLSLDLDAQEFTVVYGSLPTNDKEIAMLSRSMLEILIELSSRIDVPETHVAEERAFPTFVGGSAEDYDLPPLFRVQSDREEPVDAFVAVEYRDHWFWIDDRDLRSKRVFSFLMYLFSLAERGEPQQAPVLTIPTG